MWGAFPLYFALLTMVSPIEVVAHRIVWSLAFLILVVSVTRRWADVVQAVRSRRTLGLLALGAICVSINWTTYVWAIGHGYVVESSLGYFMNPLLAVLLGVIVFRERLRRGQWIAVMFAAAALVVLTMSVGHFPIVGLVIALSFAFYGLMKKLAGVSGMASLTVETTLLLPVALTVIGVMNAAGATGFGSLGWGTSLLMVLLGPITAVPLIAFGAAANRLPLSTIGLMQYITPMSAFILGITVFGEHQTPAEWAGFGLVWIGLIVFAVDAFRATRPSRLDPLEVGDTV
jgi:chloramphenicol-sensitive protein RarD